MYSLFGLLFLKLGKQVNRIDMKKEVVLTVRVDSKINAIVQSLAKEDDRTTAWVLRKLIIEALETRGLLEAKKKSKVK